MIHASVVAAARRAGIVSSSLVGIVSTRIPSNFIGSAFYRKYTSVVISNVYPDVSASAACVRTNSIVQGLARLPIKARRGDFKTDDNGDSSTTSSGISSTTTTAADANNRVYYATSVDISDNKERENPFLGDDLNPLDDPESSAGTIQMIHLPPNRSDLAEKHFSMETNDSLEPKSTTNATKNDSDEDQNDIRNKIVDLVIFDRFFVEEAHSFRFREAFPNAAMVLDMQDMHSLRWGRQAIVENWDKEKRQETLYKQCDWDPLKCLPRVMEYLPTAGETTKRNDRFLRELASIHRSDLVLVCSPKEMQLLQIVYNVPKEKLCLASFFVEEKLLQNSINPLPKTPSNTNSIPPRFVFCGGFKHAPNADAVQMLIEWVWPKLKSKLPNASLHIYGAFCPDKLIAQSKTHKPEGIYIHGYEPDLANIFGQDGGILLAPLRFGAGIKGKIIDAWTFGMPVVTTPIGSEGMTRSTSIDDGVNIDQSDALFGGSIASTLDDFCEKAIVIAQCPQTYREAQKNGRFLLRHLFSAPENWSNVRERLLKVMDKENLSQQRETDCTQAILWHQSLRSTEYFSRWVELKETIARDT